MKPLYIAILAALSILGCQASFRVPKDSFLKKIDISACDLKAPDKTSYLLSDIYSKHKATVIIFWQIGCPCVKRYQNRINKLYERFKEMSVAFFYVSSNKESFEKVKTEYKKRSIPLPLLRDEGGSLAKALGIKSTPSTAIIDQTGKVVFIGWIDNEYHENETGRITYVENALLDLLNQNSVRVSTSPMFGCGIR